MLSLIIVQFAEKIIFCFLNSRVVYKIAQLNTL